MMHGTGLVSIIMPAYNSADFIEETIRSVQAQTYPHWELLVVDDCSTDATREVVEALAHSDARIRYERLERNSGAAVARNRAMAMARGSYMAFLDSDDLWHPEKLERQTRFMSTRGVRFCCTSYEQVDEQGAPTGKVIRSPRRIGYNRLLLDCPVGNSTVMYDVSQMGKFEVPDIRKRNDDALWLRMLRRERYIWGMPDVLMSYRLRGGSISANKLSLVKYHWRLYREIERLSIIRSAFHLTVWGLIKVMRVK
ncbi:glycosyltransferase family 2 protein [Actinomyces bowdenii]|nr:glycosyltransferase family 2 protein [Actinomyces bowdenii]MBO3723833.1 glycosyltransferase family 2 protein [Actinomyces bowdenii]